MTENFKSQWERVDEVCPCCGQVTKRVRGITRQNIKRLFTPQFNLTELIITFMIIMMIVLSYAYLKETKECRDWITPLFKEDKDNCYQVCSFRCEMAYTNEPLNELNVSIVNSFNNGG